MKTQNKLIATAKAMNSGNLVQRNFTDVPSIIATKIATNTIPITLASERTISASSPEIRNSVQKALHTNAPKYAHF